MSHVFADSNAAETASYDNDASSARYSWPEHLTQALGRDIVTLMRETTAGDPIIGFAETISDAEAQAYVEELAGNLHKRKCRLLAIHSRQDTLVGLCTLRRNHNPNNRHIVDLAKGMIKPAWRGGRILAEAFAEIAAQCERDGAALVTLDVRAGSRAQQVWERFGFITYGILPDYARVDGESLAGHFMMQPVEQLKHNARLALQRKSWNRSSAN
jgi:hypothetical protein